MTVPAYSLEDLPLVIQQEAGEDRRELLRAILGGVVSAALLAFSIVLGPRATELALISGVCLIWAIGAGLYAGRTQGFRERLTISREGLEHAGRIRTRKWAWTDIVGFNERDGTIFVDSTTPRNMALDWFGRDLGGPWPMNAFALAVLLTEAKRRFG